ncbi:MAG: CoA transferase [Alphaproteobacteria bacterium]|nr:CoA transferase [Alphaproteobacteria bacterium]
MTDKSLAGLRVLDLSRILAGPYATQMLGDLGAEIIKVEKPFAGDDTRLWGPPFLKDANGHDTSESAYYLSTNRNKKSIAIDITCKAGQELVHALLAHCDILVENFKTGGLAKYGLSYEQLAQAYPHLIYCSITGFGQTGPLASEPGYDLVAQAMGGLMAATGEPSGEPMKAGVAVTDIITGLHALVGILAALHHREKTGQGQHIDLSLLDCTLATMSNLAQYYLISGHPAPRQGNAHATIVPYQAVQTQTGWVVIAVGNDPQFAKLATSLGHPEWISDPRFSTTDHRLAHRNELIPLLTDALQHFSAEAFVDLCRSHDIPAGPVHTMDKAFAEPQIQSRQMQIKMTHPLASKPVSLVGSPLKLSQTPPAYESPPPTLGEQTDEILKAILGMGTDEIARLRRQKTIA